MDLCGKSWKSFQKRLFQKNIEFLGYRTDRLRIVNKMDLFTMTSSLEGIPRCMMEAMALGIPVAAYNIPGVDQLIKSNKTGLLAEYGDTEGLKNCWEKILYDDSLARSLSNSGRQYIKEYYSAKRMAKEYTILYKGLRLSH